jgi:hypothetical protein
VYAYRGFIWGLSKAAGRARVRSNFGSLKAGKDGSSKQTEARVLRVFLLIAFCAVAWPSIAFAVTDAPGQTGAFVAYCKTDSEGITEKIAGTYAAMLINNTIAVGQARNRKWCPAAEANDMKVLTPKVTEWLTAHPEANSKTTNEGIEMAVIQLYPCKR